MTLRRVSDEDSLLCRILRAHWQTIDVVWSERAIWILALTLEWLTH